MHTIAMYLIFPWRQRDSFCSAQSVPASVEPPLIQGQDARGWRVHLADVRVKKEKSNVGFFEVFSPSNGMKFREQACVV